MIYTLHITQKGFNVKLNANKKTDTSILLVFISAFSKEEYLEVVSGRKALNFSNCEHFKTMISHTYTRDNGKGVILSDLFYFFG